MSTCVLLHLSDWVVGVLPHARISSTHAREGPPTDGARRRCFAKDGVMSSGVKAAATRRVDVLCVSEKQKQQPR